MPIDYPVILEGREARSYRWGDREVMLYALGVGMGRDPLDLRELDYVFERALKVMPSFVTVAAPRAGARLLAGLDYARVVDAERVIRLHRPLPASAVVNAMTRVARVVDKGPGRGALVTRETVLCAEGEEPPLAEILTTTFARGDGGCGGGDAAVDVAPPRPDRSPDRAIDVATLPDQALLYRLCGDRNPLHVDPVVACKAGFDRPILHGMCSFGIACRVLLREWLDYDPAAIASLRARFTAAVYPGETLRFALWRDRDRLWFEADVVGRAAVALRGGFAELR